MSTDVISDASTRAGREPQPDTSAAPSVREEPGPRGGVPRRAINAIIPSVLVLAGVSVLLYPVIATQWNNHKQHAFAAEYNADVSKIDDSALTAALASAREYNTRIDGVPILDPYLDEDQNPESEAYSDYMSQLSLLGTMARVRVPSVKIDLPVRHGTSDEVLLEGAGHLYGTSLPVGGAGTHAVLTSHTGMTEATLFDNLIDVKKGDLVLVDVYGETLAYEVDQIKVVLPEEISDLVPVAGEDYLTLFTCTPYAVNSHRLLVRGYRVPYTAQADAEATKDGSRFLLQPWMWWLLLAAVIGLVSLGAIAWRERRLRRRTQEGAAHGGADEAGREPAGSTDSANGHASAGTTDPADGTAPVTVGGDVASGPGPARGAVAGTAGATPAADPTVGPTSAAPSPNEDGPSWTRPVDWPSD